MKLLITLCSILLVPGCVSPAERGAQPLASASGDGVQTPAQGLALDAAKVVEKLAACNHFTGEFGGDNSARDREVTAAITQLRCETIDEDVRRILAKYPGNQALMSALKRASEP